MKSFMREKRWEPQHPSNLTFELMNVSDTTVAIKLVFIDGSEKIIVSYNPDESFIQGGSISFSSKEEATQQQKLEFTEVLNIGEAVGVYIEDVYLSVKRGGCARAHTLGSPNSLFWRCL